MRISGVNERMAQVLKMVYNDAGRVLQPKELAKKFAVSEFTSRSDLKSLTELGFLEVIKVNKQKKNYIKSKAFDKLIAKVKS